VLSVALFRRLAFLTALFAYLQIALGGVVRVTGSGLGCPDWPLCHGRPYPAGDIHSIIEYSHRSVGFVTGWLVVLTVLLAWMLVRRRPVVPLLGLGALVAIAVEGALGGAVVIQELAPWLVLFHLALAMLILGFLLATAVMSLPASPGAGSSRFRLLAAGGAAATYILLLTGSTVVASGADDGCHSWPLCGGGFALDFSGVNGYTMLHRGAALLLGVLIVYVVIRALRTARLRPVAVATLAAFVLQVAIGAGAALTNAGVFNGLHVAIATLVWAGMLSIALLSMPRADRAESLSRLSVEKRLT
jgi:heme A synthase